MVSHKIKKRKARIEGTNKQPKNKGAIITILIIIIAAAVIGYVSDWTYYIPQAANNGELVAEVNGEPIYSTEFEEQWESLPVQAKMQIDRVQLLDQLISEKLLLQKAKKEHIEISDEEVDQFINTQLQQSGMSFEQYEQLLSVQGTDLETMRIAYTKQLSVAKLFEETVTDNINPTMEEIETYYEENKEQFYRQEQVTVRHILIQINENFNETQAMERVELIENELDQTNNENFCDLVSNYSMDFGSKENCGEYTFPRGVMVPEFENASFEMSPDERRVVKSDFGYHIILKIEDILEEYMQIDDVIVEYPNQPTVQQMINQTLAQEKAKTVFDNYVQTLFDEANIEYYDLELTPAEAMSLEN